jgi:hypothetical protein
VKTSILIVCAAVLSAGTAVRADHNSKNGDGWANMPNAVHDYRIDSDDVPPVCRLSHSGGIDHSGGLSGRGISVTARAGKRDRLAT